MMSNELTATEVRLLNAVRSNLYSEVTVKVKNGIISRIFKTNTKSHSGYRELIRELSKLKFGEFHLKVENGNIVFSEVVECERA